MKQTLGGRKQNFVCTRTQEEGAVTPQETDSVLPVNVQESLVEAWVGSGLLQGRGSKGGRACMGLLKEVTIIFITSTIIWLQVNNREGTQLHSSTENWVKDLLSMAPPIKTRLSFPLSQSLSSGSFHKPLILIPQRADRMKIAITKNSSNCYIDHSLI